MSPTERQLRIEKAIEEVTLETKDHHRKLGLLYKALAREQSKISEKEQEKENGKDI